MKLVGAILILTLLLFMGACSSTSQAPAQGSPEWLWAAARDSYTAGDLEKACDHLRKIESKGGNPYVERAGAWRLLIEAGSANAQMELAKAYNDGKKYSKTEQNVYARRRSEHLNEAKRHGIELFESFGVFAKNISDKPLVLEFPFPQGNAAPVMDLERVYKGMSVSEEAASATNDKVMKRGLVRAVGAVLATEDDSAKAQGSFKDGKAEVPAARFLLAMAMSLDRASLAFDRKNLNEPDKQKLFETKAMDTLGKVLAAKPDAITEKAAKKLKADIDKKMKELTKGKKG